MDGDFVLGGKWMLAGKVVSLVRMGLAILVSGSSIAWGSSGYFTIQDQDSPNRQTQQESIQLPLDMIREGLSPALSSVALSLLNWIHHSELQPTPSEPYNRKLHFGTWVNDPTDDTCYNTRAKVLMRDSIEPVVFKPRNHCIVDSGRWEDPYSGVTHTSARDIQIDHVVPLKNAYSSGAWTWTSKKRCLYANFLSNSFHLLSVDGHENMAKGDSAPDGYIPPKRSYVCQYLKNWLKVKIIWDLEMTESEAAAIRDDVTQFGCNPKDFTITNQDLNKQRSATDEMQALCNQMSIRMDQAASKGN